MAAICKAAYSYFRSQQQVWVLLLAEEEDT